MGELNKIELLATIRRLNSEMKELEQRVRWLEKRVEDLLYKAGK